MFGQLTKLGYQVLALHHAEAILKHDMPEAVLEIEKSLKSFRIEIDELVRKGGGEASFTQRLRRELSNVHGWKKHNFQISRIVDGVETESLSHEIDHVKKFDSGTIALEIEWNNKDPFYDRDLENFKRLHADGVISVGVIVTRGTSLQVNMEEMIRNFAAKNRLKSLADLDKLYEPTTRQKNLIASSVESKGSFEAGWAHAFVKDKFGTATTHWGKLEDRVHRGVGNPCPLLLIGIPDTIVTE